MVLSVRAKIEILLNAKSCQRGPGLVTIVINNPLGEDQGGSIPLDAALLSAIPIRMVRAENHIPLRGNNAQSPTIQLLWKST